MTMSKLYQNTTIAAIATPIGSGGVGIVRMSGKDAYLIAQKLTKRETLQPRRAHFCQLYDKNGAMIDEAVVLYFKAPHSFTGEDVVELQGHGGMVLQNLILTRCFELGARQANAGEFSYRAFDNGKLDLVQAEAIADAISATSTAQAVSAIRSLSGEFSKKINALSEQIVHIRLYVEASIDFSDEEDVRFLSDGVIATKLNQLLTQLDEILANAKQGQLLRDGVQAVLAGRPNAGKSSLLNRLAGVERAIVTEMAGTTRDTLCETVLLDGLSVNLTDTAGLRQTADKVEKIGIDRAKNAINQADILLFVYDVNCEQTPLELAKELFAWQIEKYGEIEFERKLIMVANKADLLDNVSHETLCQQMAYSDKQVIVSCETGEGIDELVRLLKQKVDFSPPENALIARTRHLDSLNTTKLHILEAQTQLLVYQAGELVAESLRLAHRALGEITGQMSADDLLGKIFSSFCIGK